MKPLPETGLPPPDADSASHARKVAAHVRELIGNDSISFAEFMQAVLYAPGLGYYVAGNRKFGREGDFVTAPEVSRLFGRVVANQCAAILDELDAGAVLELGAGSGSLAVSMLQRLGELDRLPDSYLILEVSPELQERQRKRIATDLPGDLDRVHWIDRLPTAMTGVVVANEVADAIPVERFRLQDGQVLQARVAADGNGFRWQFDPAPDWLVEWVRTIERETGYAFPDGYQSEVSPGVSRWVCDVCAAIERGAFLLFDYGLPRREYYAQDRSDGWLNCHFRHRAHTDPLALTGIQDVTAWIDFTAVAEAAARSDMTIAGYTTQAAFLLHGGLDAELSQLASLDVARQAALSAEVKMLTLPGEMGENFKAIGLCRGVSAPPAFRQSDKAHLL